MSIDRSTLLFIDAAALIAASGRVNGGSGFILSLIERGLLRGAVSIPVLSEAERNIRMKLRPAALDTYFQLLTRISWLITEVPSSEHVEQYPHHITKKDVHVVAAALAAHASYLITLDRRLLAAVNAAGFPILAITPGDFIRTVLQHHPDLPEEVRREPSG